MSLARRKRRLVRAYFAAMREDNQIRIKAIRRAYWRLVDQGRGK